MEVFPNSFFDLITMSENFLENFIIIDDDKLNNKLCRVILQKAYPEALIHDFSDPLLGFEHIANTYSEPGNNQSAVLLLDIMMPVMDAWDFLDKFDKLDELTKSRIKIYILSSSINKNDMARAQSNKYVEYYLIKPLNKESIRLIVHVLHKRLGVA
jgi:CheY-like chemotaxis protein